MGVIGVSIDQPVHDQVLVGGQAVQFSGHLDPATTPAGPLYVRWYSSIPVQDTVALGSPPDTRKAAFQVPVDHQWDFTQDLRLGSQAITVAVKDQDREDAATMAVVHAAGSAGGGPEAPTPCVVHVLVARSVLPAVPATPQDIVAISRSEGVFAESPRDWPTAAYQALNALVYDWTFRTKAGAVITNVRVSGTNRPGESATFIPATAATPALLGVRPVPSAVASGVEASVQLTVSDARGRTSDSTPTIKIQVSG